jgi:phenylacetic acid degradation operon negative regulatory protein
VRIAVNLKALALGPVPRMAQPMNAAPFLDALHADKPLRVWSLIVTIFGDIVVRQGQDPDPGPIWTGHLLDLLERLGVDAGLARTSLSRLVANGVLVRERNGRNTFYRLSRNIAAEFVSASDLIYGRKLPVPTGMLFVAAIDRVPDRAAARKRLESDGFRFLSATTGLRPAHEQKPLAEMPGQCILAETPAIGESARAVRELWRIDALNQAYADFIRRFAAMTPQLSPDVAIVARVVLVHRMRRLLLRDPFLPASALPADWAGDAARNVFSRCLGGVNEPSEHWLSETGFRSGEIQSVTEKIEI